MQNICHLEEKKFRVTTFIVARQALSDVCILSVFTVYNNRRHHNNTFYENESMPLYMYVVWPWRKENADGIAKLNVEEVSIIPRVKLSSGSEPKYACLKADWPTLVICKNKPLSALSEIQHIFEITNLWKFRLLVISHWSHWKIASPPLPISIFTEFRFKACKIKSDCFTSLSKPLAPFRWQIFLVQIPSSQFFFV